MKFGPVDIDSADGALLAHAMDVAGRRYKKAHRLTAQDVAAFRREGIDSVIAARLEPGDMDEDEAAAAIVRSMRLPGMEATAPATGRVNLHAADAGVFSAERATIDAANAIDPAITIATLSDKTAVTRGQMVATVKIIPFAVPSQRVVQAATILSAPGCVRVDAFRPQTIALIQTVLGTTREQVLDKTNRVTAARLARSGSTIVAERRVAHDAAAVARALDETMGDAEMAIVFGASAMCDFDDVIPAAIRRVGGIVVRAGMPVDPGNLLVLGTVAGRTVIGAPGCARSPKENGFDWVLDRLMAGLDVTSDDIAGMGVGGLLMEIASRPRPREAETATPELRIGAVILAAGRSSRMGGPNKLMADFDGKPLVRRVAAAVVGSRVSSSTLVTGHQSDRVQGAVAGLDLSIVHNPDYADGLSTSLKAGLAGIPLDAAGALVVLGDMPMVGSAELDRLIDAFKASGGKRAVRATHDGKRGNPVILPRAMFAAIAGLAGDTGARHLVEGEGTDVVDVEIGAAASLDVDTPEALSDAGGVLQG